MPDTKKTRGAKASAAADKGSPAIGGRPNKLAPAKAARDVKVAVDGKLKKRWDETLGVIRKAKGQGAEAFDELWEAVADVVEHEPPLYVIGGFASPKEFFEEVLQEKERTARRFIRVAKFATPHEEAKYGTTVLDAALAFIEATAGGPLSGPLPVAFDRLRIPVLRNGKATRIPLEEATAEEIAKATRDLMHQKGKSRSTASPFEGAIVKALSAHAEIKGVRVTVRGETATFSGVPVKSLAAFGRSLAGVKLPALSGSEEGAGGSSKVRSSKKKPGK